MRWQKSLFHFRELEDQPKPFLDHIEDLRTMLIRMAVALVSAMVIGFLGRQWLFGIIQRPLAKVDAERADNLQSLGVVDSFSISLELAFYSGIVMAFPFLLYFLAEFVLPALTARERRYIWPAAAIGFGLFLSGVSFAYFVVLPGALSFFYADAQSLGWQPTWTVREYYSFTTQFVIAFGLAFELPVVVLLLVKLDVLSAADLKRIRAQAFVAILLFAAILTPTTDFITMMLMGGPMYLLYEACIWIAWFMGRGKKPDPQPDSDDVLDAIENGSEDE